ncbi:MAG: fimbrillin family protein [Candidatus Cryptobacteroides sp.]
MKTSYGLLMTALILGCGILSCSKSEADFHNDEICLRVPITKATGLPENEIFGVFLTVNDQPQGTEWGGAWSAEQEYLNDVAFKHFAASELGTAQDYWAGCDYATLTHKPYYYPVQGSLLAIGYSPYKEQSKGTVLSVTHNSNLQNQTAKNPLLLIGFKQNMDPAQMDTLRYFRPADVNNGYSFSSKTPSVPILFHHALCKVQFCFLSDNDWYRIYNVRLMGCVNEGTFFNANSPGFLPTLSSATNDGYLLQGESTTDLSGYESPELFLLPQYTDGVFTSGNTGTFIRLEFDITDKDEFSSQHVVLSLDSPETEEAKQDGVIYLSGLTKHWEMGKFYRYNITINPRPIDFSLDIEVFTDIATEM